MSAGQDAEPQFLTPISAFPAHSALKIRIRNAEYAEDAEMLLTEHAVVEVLGETSLVFSGECQRFFIAQRHSTSAVT